MTPTSTLRIRDVSKRYRGRAGVLANDGVSLDVAPGSVVGLLGHNGAGKTTLVNQVVGLVRPDSGSITIDGVDAITQPHVARQLVSVQAQANVPITGLTPRHAIELVGRIRGMARQEVSRRAQDLLERLDLERWADTPSQKVSGGIARLTAFAMTAVVPGRLVVLDEPTNDVDPVRRRLLWEQIRALADSGSAVLLVTHNVREAERVVDHLVVLDRGRVIAADTPAGMATPLQGALTVEVDVAPGTSAHLPAIVDLATQPEPGRESLRVTGTVRPDDAADFVRWAQAEVDAKRIERYAVTPASLEDVYVRLVGADDAGAGGHDQILPPPEPTSTPSGDPSAAALARTGERA